MLKLVLLILAAVAFVVAFLGGITTYPKLRFEWLGAALLVWALYLPVS